MADRISLELHDCSDVPSEGRPVLWRSSIKVHIAASPDVIDISSPAYGVAGLVDGYGGLISMELYEGRWRLLVWADINDENPTHVIDMEGARLDRRKNKEIMDVVEELDI